MNNELKTSTQQKGQKCRKHTTEAGRSKELIYPRTISKQMAGKAGRPTTVGDKPLPEVGQVADHKAHLLSQ
jgi:hypothetical protein